VPKKQPKQKAKALPQFDASPLDDEDESQGLGILDDDGNMVLRRTAKPPTKGVRRGKGKSTKPAR
jgi:hypothetical protein